MENLLFSRVVEVVVGGTDVSALEVEFEVEADLAPGPDTATLRIFNASADTRGAIHGYPKHSPVRIKAGYKNSVPLIFSGELRRVFTAREEGDIITTVECGAGDTARSLTRRLDKSYGSGSNVSVVLNDLLSACGLGKGNLPTILSRVDFEGVSKQFFDGLVCSGPAWDQLRDILDHSGYDCTVQNGALVAVLRQGAAEGTAVLLTSETGLVGSPSVDKSGVLTCETLMVPDIFPGRKIQVQSEFVNGTFTVSRCAYSGSLFGSEFGIAIETKKKTTT